MASDYVDVYEADGPPRCKLCLCLESLTHARKMFKETRAIPRFASCLLDGRPVRTGPQNSKLNSGTKSGKDRYELIR